MLFPKQCTLNDIPETPGVHTSVYWERIRRVLLCLHNRIKRTDGQDLTSDFSAGHLALYIPSYIVTPWHFGTFDEAIGPNAFMLSISLRVMIWWFHVHLRNRSRADVCLWTRNNFVILPKWMSLVLSVCSFVPYIDQHRVVLFWNVHDMSQTVRHGVCDREANSLEVYTLYWSCQEHKRRHIYNRKYGIYIDVNWDASVLSVSRTWGGYRHLLGHWPLLIQLGSLLVSLWLKMSLYCNSNVTQGVKLWYTVF